MDKMEQGPSPHQPGFMPPAYVPQPGYMPPQPDMRCPLPNPNPPPQQNVVISSVAFGPESQHMICPHCHANVSTRIETEANTKTHLFALLLCLLGCWCCAPCPYCMDTCMVKKHYCPACTAYLGSSDN